MPRYDRTDYPGVVPLTTEGEPIAFGLATTATTSATVVTGVGTNGTVLKALPGSITDIVLSNNTASNKWLKLYNKTVQPNLATDIPVAKLLIKPGETLAINMTGPMRFGAGIAYAITGGVGNADTTATAADDVSGFITYV